MNLQEIIKDQSTVLVDVRTPAEFSEGSAKNAINIPLDRIQAEADALKGKGTIVVFCRSGNRSAQAKFLLERLGFNNVINAGTWEDVAMLQN